MFWVIITFHCDDYKNCNDNYIYRHCKTRKEADQAVINEIYEYLDEYFAGENENLKDIANYTMDNINDLLTMIKPTYIKSKFSFSIREV
jgi:hypothetical protein